MLEKAIKKFLVFVQNIAGCVAAKKYIFSYHKRNLRFIKVITQIELTKQTLQSLISITMPKTSTQSSIPGGRATGNQNSSNVQEAFQILRAVG